MVQKKYESRGALAQRLRRDGFVAPESLATLLLDLKYELEWTLPAKRYDRTKLASPGINYRAWIGQLMAFGYINPKDTQVSPKDYITYTPGYKLIPYINREKSFRFEMASLREVIERIDPVNGRMTDLSTEVGSLKNEVGTLKSKVESLQNVDEEREEAIKKICSILGIPYKRPGHVALLSLVKGGSSK